MLKSIIRRKLYKRILLALLFKPEMPEDDFVPCIAGIAIPKFSIIGKETRD